jgi:hypothetical protein
MTARMTDADPVAFNDKTRKLLGAKNVGTVATLARLIVPSPR